MIGFLKKKGRVLLLDDDPAIQRLVAKILRGEGYKVDVVGKGNQAIEAIAKDKYDAILLDLMMPHEGGMTVIRHLKNVNPALLQRVVLLTATPEAVLRTIEQDVFAVVHKPFDPANLVKTVERLV